MGDFGGSKGKREKLYLNYNLKINKIELTLEFGIEGKKSQSIDLVCL